ncbi:hypothetical protein [Psychrobacter sp. I-STPA10]|uniref:hypothetical protein n=1 Tax=Psychrobacter sp. I-STPA10 TaxID=2585769 RepID=UPI001E2E54BB|nr:hypothetical protein [Psychrobacter sp. I-STPA10]
MNAYIQQFIDAISPNICWNIYPEYIEGLTEQQLTQLAHAGDIEIHGEFKQWLLTFGKCSGGLFLAYDFKIYGVASTWQNYLEQCSDTEICRLEQLEDGLITKEQLDLKPLYIYTENETHHYYIFTKDPDLFVWFNDDGANMPIPMVNTGLRFNDFVKQKLSTLRCNPGVWLDKEEVLRFSCTYI